MHQGKCEPICSDPIDSGNLPRTDLRNWRISASNRHLLTGNGNEFTFANYSRFGIFGEGLHKPRTQSGQCDRITRRLQEGLKVKDVGGLKGPFTRLD